MDPVVGDDLDVGLPVPVELVVDEAVGGRGRPRELHRLGVQRGGGEVEGRRQDEIAEVVLGGADVHRSPTFLEGGGLEAAPGDDLAGADLEILQPEGAVGTGRRDVVAERHGGARDRVAVLHDPAVRRAGVDARGQRAEEWEGEQRAAHGARHCDAWADRGTRISRS